MTWVSPGAGQVAHFTTQHAREQGGVRAACGLTVRPAEAAPYRSRCQRCLKEIKMAQAAPPERVRVAFLVSLECDNGDEDNYRQRIASTFGRSNKVRNVSVVQQDITPIEPDDT